MTRATDLSAFLHKELVSVMCGELLGQGSARQVFAHAFNPNLVIKFESNANSFQNVTEWQTWEAVRDTEHAKWFAPCIAISDCGGVLIQARTQRASVHPDKVPNFFTDLKCANFGMLQPKAEEKPRFVCHDYGVHLMLEHGLTKRMRKANWWNL